MNNDKIDRLIEQVQQNRARFLAGLQKTQEVQKEMRESPKEIEKRIGNLEIMMLRLINITFKNSEMVDNLCKKIDKSTDAHKQTIERFDAVLLMAEKYFCGNTGDFKEK